jgi:hypothetical protein
MQSKLITLEGMMYHGFQGFFTLLITPSNLALLLHRLNTIIMWLIRCSMTDPPNKNFDLTSVKRSLVKPSAHV